VDQLLLYCYHLDPMTGRYSLQIINVLRLAALATAILVGAAIWIMRRREQLSAGAGPC